MTSEIIGREKVNPRHQREKYKDWVGKRVVVGLSTFHYVCGVWESTDAENNVLFRVGDRELKVPITQIDTIGEALPYQADFYK